MKAVGSRRREWVVDVEKTLHKADASVELSLWQRHSIYRVPACIKDLNPKVYRPQVLSLGPFHHGARELVPMEEHKWRALQHLLRRTKRPLEMLAAVVEEVLEELLSAYLDLGAEWREGDGRERFLQMMVLDGCFLLEVMRAAGRDGKGGGDEYAPNDPIFSHHGALYMLPYICRDMLVLENQLPLLLLQKLVAVENDNAPVNCFILYSLFSKCKVQQAKHRIKQLVGVMYIFFIFIRVVLFILCFFFASKPNKAKAKPVGFFWYGRTLTRPVRLAGG
jgi:hypothetical protein